MLHVTDGVNGRIRIVYTVDALKGDRFITVEYRGDSGMACMDTATTTYKDPRYTEELRYAFQVAEGVITEAMWHTAHVEALIDSIRQLTSQVDNLTNLRDEVINRLLSLTRN